MSETDTTARDTARRAATASGRPLGAALVAAALSLAVVLVAPAGGDQAAHLYLTETWRDHGWQLWDNFWYSGRYAQVNYSLLFYPLAALLGPAAVVAGSCAGAAAGFAALVRRRWSAIATWPSLAFAALVPLAAFAGTYPFLLGLALAMGALAALAAGRFGWALAGVAGAVLAHPLALAFLLVVLLTVAASAPEWWRSRRALTFAIGTVAVAAAQGVLLRGFTAPDARYPFDPKDALAIAVFCASGLLLTRGLPDQRPLRALFVGYAVLGALAFVLSTPLGGNAVRLVFLMGAPLLLLPLAARGFRPRRISTALLAGALLLQALPAVAGWRTAIEARAASVEFWYPAIAFLESRHDPDFRVQVVATADNWEAYHLAGRGVPLARGWYRQDDFPANAILYEEPLPPARYQAWLRRTGVRYVLLPDDPLDYSARGEAALLRSGESGLREVGQVGGWTFFELRRPTPIATPARHIRVTSLTSDAIALRVDRPGVYRLRVRYTPYWRVQRGAACVAPRAPWGTELRVRRPGVVRLTFRVRLGTFVGTVIGSEGDCGLPLHGPRVPWAPLPEPPEEPAAPA